MPYENKYTKEDLKIMQSWDLDRKIRVTQTRIMEWYMRFKGQVYVSFSGGKDSTVLLDLARRIYPDIPAVYVDTGLEYPEIKEFVKTQDNITIIRPEKSFRQVILEYGYPVISKEVAKIIYGARHGISERSKSNYVRKLEGLNPDDSYSEYKQRYKKYKYLLDAPFGISNRCCLQIKEKPARKYERETGRKCIIATMATESEQRTSGWLKTGCNAFDSAIQISKPMSFWTEQDVLQYIKRFNIPYASVYGEITPTNENPNVLKTTKCDRTGCVFCAFGCHLEKEPNRFQRLKQTHPKLHEYCLKPIEDGGLGMKDVLDYIGVKYD